MFNGNGPARLEGGEGGWEWGYRTWDGKKGGGGRGKGRGVFYMGEEEIEGGGGRGEERRRGGRWPFPRVSGSFFS